MVNEPFHTQVSGSVEYVYVGCRLEIRSSKSGEYPPTYTHLLELPLHCPQIPLCLLQLLGQGGGPGLLAGGPVAGPSQRISESSHLLALALCLLELIPQPGCL